MMKAGKVSLRIMQMRRVLDLTSAVEIPGVLPRTLEVQGSRLDLASAVEVNRTLAPAFAALSQNRLLVQLPNRMTDRVMELAVFSDALEPGSTSRVYYDIGIHPWFSEGKARVLQIFIKQLLTTPGTDVFSPRSGAGLQKLVARNIDSQSELALSGEIESRISSTAQRMIQTQVNDPTVPTSERLLNVKVNGIVVSTAEQSLNVQLRMVFQDGESLTAGFGW